MKQGDPVRRMFVLIGAWMSLVLFIPVAHATDAPGCADVAGLKRFNGPSIVMCVKRDFTEYLLPTGKNTGYDFDLEEGHVRSLYESRGAPHAKRLRCSRGMFPRRTYFVTTRPTRRERVHPAVRSEAERYGDRILAHSSKGWDPARKSGLIVPDEASATSRRSRRKAARKYISLLHCRISGWLRAKIQSEKGSGDGPPRRASGWSDRGPDGRRIGGGEITKDLAKDGKVALYGILFDFNKATIKPESRAALDEIGKFPAEQSVAKRLCHRPHRQCWRLRSPICSYRTGRASAVAADLARILRHTSQPDDSEWRRLAAGARCLQRDGGEGRAKNRRVGTLAPGDGDAFRGLHSGSVSASRDMHAADG